MVDWMEFYQEFADKLLPYRSNRDELVKKVSRVYEMTSLPMPKLESGELRDIDPFTIFGFFNKGITESNRIAILKVVKTLFAVEAAVPDKFTGIPVLNNMHACFYRFSDDERRGEADIDDLWELFSSAIRYASDANRGTDFDHSDDCKDGDVTDKWLRQVGNHKLVPVLREYWYDNREMAEEWIGRLRKAVE